jgi:type VI secretion system protein ImpA
MSNKPDWSEFDQFLKPISKDSPAGSSLQYDATYDEIREARRHEDTRLPQGVWQRDLKVADWSKSTKICTDALINKSKDLQVAAWLAESWLHEKGIRGLLSGIRLMHALCDQFWGTLHPLIDEDGADHRLAPIDWLNEKLPEQLTLYAISNPELGNVPYYSLAEYEYLQSHGDKSSSVKALPDPKEMTQAALQTSIKDTPNYFYEVLYNDCLKTIGALEDFESFLSDKVSSDAVSLYQLRASLGKFRDCMLSVLRERDLLGVDVKTL